MSNSSSKWCPFRGIATGTLLSGAISTKDEGIITALGKEVGSACLREKCGIWNGRRCGFAESPTRQVRFLR